MLEERTNSLGPMTVSEILDNTFWVYGKNLPAILMFSAAIGGIFRLVMYFITKQIGPAISYEPWLDFFENPNGILEFEPESIMEMWPQIFRFQGVVMLLSMVNAIFIKPFVHGGIINLTYNHIKGQRLSARESLISISKRFWKLALTGLSLIPYFIGVGIVLIILMVIFLIPLVLLGAAMSNDPTGGRLAGFIFMLLITIAAIIILLILSGIFIAFTYHAVTIEENYGFNAIVRSFKLVGKKFWRVLGISLLIYLIVGIAGGILSFVAGITSMVTPNTFISNYATGFIVTAFVTPILYIATTLLFLDIRTRVEGI